MSDRRLYIHEHTIAEAIMEGGPEAADVIVGALASTAVAKIVHHTFAADGVALGLVEPALAAAVDARAAGVARGGLTRALRALELRGHRVNGVRGMRLLGPDEVVVASCMDSGYFTFATGNQAAIRMYDDTCSLRVLRSDVNSGRGPADLQMIRGRSLLFVGSGAFVGPESVCAAWAGAARRAVDLAADLLEPLSLHDENVANLATRAMTACTATLGKGFFLAPVWEATGTSGTANA
jgi:hypothetical protein